MTYELTTDTKGLQNPTGFYLVDKHV